MAFFIKQLHAGGTLGEDLRELRERVNLSVEEVSLRMKLTPATIHAWETGTWHALGVERAYLEKMLIAYVRAFGAPEDFFRKKFHEEAINIRTETSSARAIQALRPFSLLDTFILHRAKAVGIVLLVLCTLGGYMVAQARGLGDAPRLEIYAPKPDIALGRPTVRVEGRTDPESRVLVNERPASVREDGTFYLDVDVPRGATELYIRAKRRSSRETTARVRVVYERTVQTTEEL
jgi:transcriptional regulator with XRE-family HTH domain